MKSTKKTTDEKRGNLSQLAQVITFVIVQAIVFCLWEFKMVIILVVPIMMNVVVGNIDLLMKHRKKVWIPEAVWRTIVLVTLLVEIIISAVETFQRDLSDFAIEIALYPIVGLIAYAIMTGQAFLTHLDRKVNDDEEDKKKLALEYVPSVNMYRDKNGNYYTEKKVPTAPPVVIKK